MLPWIFIILNWGHPRPLLFHQRWSGYSDGEEGTQTAASHDLKIPRQAGADRVWWCWWAGVEVGGGGEGGVGWLECPGRVAQKRSHTLGCRGSGGSGGQTVVQRGERLWPSDEKPGWIAGVLMPRRSRRPELCGLWGYQSGLMRLWISITANAPPRLCDKLDKLPVYGRAT